MALPSQGETAAEGQACFWMRDDTPGNAGTGTPEGTGLRALEDKRPKVTPGGCLAGGRHLTPAWGQPESDYQESLWPNRPQTSC